MIYIMLFAMLISQILDRS